MIRIKTKLEGTAELRRLLKALPPEVETKVLQAATRQVGREVEKDFEAVVPRSSEDKRSPKSQQYGHMIDNIRVKAPRGFRGIVVFTKDAFWSQWYEFGNSRQPPRPVFRPTWDNNANRYMGMMLGAIARSLARTARQLAGKYGTARRTLGVRSRK
ncbi:MAG: hypothetical protein AB7R90_10475 [Reyranellaceae bacterium]